MLLAHIPVIIFKTARNMFPIIPTQEAVLIVFIQQDIGSLINGKAFRTGEGIFAVSLTQVVYIIDYKSRLHAKSAKLKKRKVRKEFIINILRLLRQPWRSLREIF